MTWLTPLAVACALLHTSVPAVHGVPRAPAADRGGPPSRAIATEAETAEAEEHAPSSAARRTPFAKDAGDFRTQHGDYAIKTQNGDDQTAPRPPATQRQKPAPAQRGTDGGFIGEKRRGENAAGTRAGRKAPPPSKKLVDHVGDVDPKLPHGLMPGVELLGSALFFDLDDVLVDTAPVVAVGLSRLLGGPLRGETNGSKN